MLLQLCYPVASWRCGRRPGGGKRNPWWTAAALVLPCTERSMQRSLTHDIDLVGEGLQHRLVLVGLEALDDHLRGAQAAAAAVSRRRT